MLTPNTHLAIDPTLSGKLTALSSDHAKVLFHTTRQMAADAQGLVHGGFLFSAADYAAMCAVNDPYVVLGAASTKFIAPVRVGDAVLFEATVIKTKGKKRKVSVVGSVEGVKVFEGSFTAFVLDGHVFEVHTVASDDKG